MAAACLYVDVCQNLPNVVTKTHLHPSSISGYVFVSDRCRPTQAHLDGLRFGV